METSVTSFRAMGCQANVWLAVNDDDAGILGQVPRWVEEIEAALSRFREDSELCRLNLQSGAWIPVSQTMYANIAQAVEAARLTDGLVTPLVLNALVGAGYVHSFDVVPSPVRTAPSSPARPWQAIRLDGSARRVWLPDQIDLGGIAKGWTAQRVADRLATYGAVLVDLGGDMVARGGPWPVQVEDPLHPDTQFTTLAVSDLAVATSGIDFRRWGPDLHHIIDPRTGRPASTDVVSATVLHPDAVTAEAFAKAVLMQGSHAGLAWLARHQEAAGAVFCQDGQVLATENFQTYMYAGA